MQEKNTTNTEEKKKSEMNCASGTGPHAQTKVRFSLVYKDAFPMESIQLSNPLVNYLNSIMYCLVFAAIFAVASAHSGGLYGAGLYTGHAIAAPVAVRSLGYSSKINHVAPLAVAHHAAPIAVAHHAAPLAVAHHAAPIAVAHHAAPIAVAHHAAPALGYAHTGHVVAPHAVRSVAYSSKINHVAAAPVLAHAAPIVGPVAYGGPIGYGHGGVVGYGHGGVVGYGHGGAVGYGHGGVVGYGHGLPVAAVATRAVGYSSKVHHVAAAPIAVAHAAPVLHHAAPVLHHAAPVLAHSGIAINNYKGSALIH